MGGRSPLSNAQASLMAVHPPGFSRNIAVLLIAGSLFCLRTKTGVNLFQNKALRHCTRAKCQRGYYACVSLFRLWLQESLSVYWGGKLAVLVLIVPAFA